MNVQLFRFPFSLKRFLPDVWKPGSGDPSGIYLTFDDGPDPVRTPQILEILSRYSVQATFFCLGKKVNENPGLFLRISEEGHLPAHHGYLHLNGWKTSLQKYVENLAAAATCFDADFFRPPYGQITPAQYLAVRKKFMLVFWDVMAYDFDSRVSAETSLQILKNYTQPGRIVVLHDYQRSQSDRFLPEYIEHCLSKGLHFRLIGQ